MIVPVKRHHPKKECYNWLVLLSLHEQDRLQNKSVHRLPSAPFYSLSLGADIIVDSVYKNQEQHMRQAASAEYSGKDMPGPLALNHILSGQVGQPLPVLGYSTVMVMWRTVRYENLLAEAAKGASSNLTNKVSDQLRECIVDRLKLYGREDSVDAEIKNELTRVRQGIEEFKCRNAKTPAKTLCLTQVGVMKP